MQLVIEGHWESLGVKVETEEVEALKHTLGLLDKLCVTDFVILPDLLRDTVKHCVGL